MTSRLAGQTINDRLLAARHSIAGQGLAKSVCKATTEEMIGPKKKHLDYLVHCTNEPNVSIPQMANLLIERSQNTNWIVVYKALVTVHHIMCYGNERFTQYLASSNCTFQLSNFFDKSGVQAVLGAKAGYDMSPFIRRYARYLNEKALAYRTVAFDFCKVKRGKEDGLLRTINSEKLLKTLPSLQGQLDALLEFDCSANDLTNGVINMCFMLLFRDLIRLFACYNDGIINLLEKYFDMNKKQCKDGLDIYKKFLVRMDRVREFLKVAENVGIDKGDIPDLTKAPSSLLDALEQHLASLDGKKTSAASTPSQASGSAFGSVSSSSHPESQTNGLNDSVRQQILAEEEAAINQFKTKLSSPTSVANNPFLNNGASARIQQQSAIDLLANNSVQFGSSKNPLDDLLELGNPFVDSFASPVQNTTPPAQSNNLWMSNGNSYSKQPVISSSAFVTESNFSSVFGTSDTHTEVTSPPASYNPFLVNDTTPSLLLDDATSGLAPTPLKDVLDYFKKDSPSNPENSLTNFDALGGVLQPSAQSIQTNGNSYPAISTTHPNNLQANSGALITGDLESSLASLAENLSISKAQVVKGIQWNSPKNGSKSGNSWTPQPLAATTGAGYKPMNQAMASPPASMQPQPFPQMQPMMAMRPIVANSTVLPAMTSGVPVMNHHPQQLLFN